MKRGGSGLNKRSSAHHPCDSPGCRKSFSRREHLRRHKLNHQSSPQWICQSCSATFMRRDLWDRHLRVSHAISTSGHYLQSASEGKTKDQFVPEPDSPVSSAVSQRRGASGRDLSLNRDSSLADTELASAAHPFMSEEQTTPWLEFNSPTHGAPLTTQLPLSSPGGATAAGPFVIGDSPDQCSTIDSHNSSISNDAELFQASFLDQSSYMASYQNLDWFMEDWSYLGITSNLADFQHPFSLLPSIATEPSDTQEDNEEDGQSLREGARSPGTPSPQSPYNVIQISPFYCDKSICRSMTDELRNKLVNWLKTVDRDLDISGPLFNIFNMRFGIHRYGRYFLTEFPVFHPALLLPEVQPFLQYYGEDPPEVLIWTLITLGWSLLDNGPNCKAAIKIHGILRKYIMEQVAVTISPSLWILQTLINLEVFGRYQGSALDYNAAKMLHSLLLDMVRRLDLQSVTQLAPKLESQATWNIEWLKWIRMETMKRIVFYTFILDVQHNLIHGGNANMSPFELNIPVTYSNFLWVTEPVEKWAALIAKEPDKQVLYLAKLKQLWNSPSLYHLRQELSPDANQTVLYGIVAVASDLRRRDEHTFAPKTKDSLDSLNEKLSSSFEVWLDRWGQNVQLLRQLSREEVGRERVWYRNCSCMLQLAYTIYEISPIDLQILAGKDFIEGRRISQRDYLRSKQKMLTWVKQERAFMATSHAASLIQERLKPDYSVQSHCSHCRWCSYLASLICWNYGYYVTGNGIDTNLVQRGQVKNFALAKRDCEEYLASMSGPLRQAGVAVGKTTGLLIIMSEILSKSTRSTTNDSLVVLRRLLGLDTAAGERTSSPMTEKSSN